jgi:hypothetical protein
MWKKFLCRLLGHNRMTTGTRKRICLRCSQQEKLCRYGSLLGWEEVTAIPGSKA